MTRNLRFVLLCGGVLTTAVGCGALNNLGGGGNSTPLPTLAEMRVEHPIFNQGVPRSSLPLLARYYTVSDQDNGDLEANYGGLRYWPRQANANRNPGEPSKASGPKFPAYTGWDALDVPGSGSERTDWLRIHLNRPATVTVVWEKSSLWLAGWTKGETTGADNKKYNTYTRKFPAGEIALGSPGAGNGEYWVLLGEASGQPSAEPALPAGVTEQQTPNTTCKSWLDNVWLAKAPDGREYQTWHPQIDPVYWCYYRHDHNSDPALVGYQAPFLYTAQYTNNQPERAEGFKGFAVRDGDIGWYINIHSETSTEQRVCARFHTVVVVATRWRTGEKLVELNYKGDFGASKQNEGNNPFFANVCNDPRRAGVKVSQEQIAQENKNASKKIRVSSDNNGYEQWDGGLVKALGMEFGGAGMGIDIQNPASACNSLDCTGIVSNGSSSTRRTIHFNNIRIRHSQALDPDGDGFFETNLYGDGPYIAGDVSSGTAPLRQYVKPGTDIKLDGGFSTEDAFRGLYTRNSNTQDVELEGALDTIN